MSNQNITLNRVAKKTVGSAPISHHGRAFAPLAATPTGIPKSGQTKPSFDVGAEQVTTPKGGKKSQTIVKRTVQRGN